ncbi:MAG TPA: hypothetical protein VGX03_15290, partial [Candidatus Binatia bacterium]|nr:hypothetical protein [Candidatus Binatia bacterium]
IPRIQKDTGSKGLTAQPLGASPPRQPEPVPAGTAKFVICDHTIEEMFKDFKNNGRGFGLELTGVRQPDRLARLLLALALVYTGLLLWGAYVIASGQQQLVDNVRKPTLSLLQTGLRFVLQLWHRGQLVRFHWHLSMLAEANNC